MLLTITTTHQPATDLGYLVGKNPKRPQYVSTSFGKAHVFFPVQSHERCTMCLLLEVDPVGMVRRKNANPSAPLEQYVNDRPYVASSFFSVAINQALRNALKGECKQKPELAGLAIPLQCALSTLPARGGETVLRKLFEPLGYQIKVKRLSLDSQFPSWGESSYYQLELEKTTSLSELLTHLYVLIPVLDNQKHYFVGEDEVEKLLEKGQGWLENHPEKEFIARRFLKNRSSLAKLALRQLAENEAPEELKPDSNKEKDEEVLEKKISLNQVRLDTLVEEVKARQPKSMIDLGCGEGKLLAHLLKVKCLEKIAGMDVSIRSLEYASQRLELERMLPKQRERIELFQGSLMYRDKRLRGFDVASAVEVIEHLDPARLKAFERVVFEDAAPNCILITTPNQEYNRKFTELKEGQFRHSDHRFEWTRAEFQSWGNRIAQTFKYSVEYKPVGPVDSELGAPTQMAVFTKEN